MKKDILESLQSVLGLVLSVCFLLLAVIGCYNARQLARAIKAMPPTAHIEVTSKELEKGAPNE